MAADLPGQDPKALWKELDPETDAVTLEQIHALARKFDRNARVALAIIPLTLIAAAFIGGQMWQMSPDALSRTTVVLNVTGVLVSCYLGFRVMFPARDPAEPAGAYLQRRLQRSLNNLRGGWLVTVLPLLPGMILGVYSAYFRYQPSAHTPPIWLRLLPLVLLVAAFAFVVVRSRAGQSRIRAQLDEMDRLLKG